MIDRKTALQLVRDGVGVLPLALLAAYAGARQLAPFERSFDPADASLGHLVARPETVTTAWLVSLSGVVPLVCIALWGARCGFSALHTVYSANALLAALAWTTATTQLLKHTVGRLRPDFLDRCHPVDGVCTGDSTEVAHGRTSFPSGHASTTFCGWVFLALFLHGTLAPRTAKSPWVASLLLAMAIPPTLVGVSRITDYRHHWDDVVAGGLLGTAFAMYWYRVQFVPPPRDEYCVVGAEEVPTIRGAPWMAPSHGDLLLPGAFVIRSPRELSDMGGMDPAPGEW